MYYYDYYNNPYDYYFRQPDLGSEWDEQEGSWRGVWRRRGNSNIFDARWTMPGAQPITAVLTMYQYGNFVFILRQNSSDGNNCAYTGTIAADGRTVSGTYRCNQGGGSWSATIRRRPQPGPGPGPRPRDLGREWHEQEGSWTGVWRRRGNSNIFDARWTMPGAQPITAVLTINRSGNFVTVQRRNSSDGNECDYTGNIGPDGRTVTGTYRCTQGGGSWRATITF